MAIPARRAIGVTLEIGCDPSLSRTLWPANGFAPRPGAAPLPDP